MATNKQIKFEDFKDIRIAMDEARDSHWLVKVRGVDVSVIKWSQEHYNGDYEIYSQEKIFDDVERYPLMKDVLIRLTELENKNETIKN